MTVENEREAIDAFNSIKDYLACVCSAVAASIYVTFNSIKDYRGVRGLRPCCCLWKLSIPLRIIKLSAIFLKFQIKIVLSIPLRIILTLSSNE